MNEREGRGLILNLSYASQLNYLKNRAPSSLTGQEVVNLEKSISKADVDRVQRNDREKIVLSQEEHCYMWTERKEGMEDSREGRYRHLFLTVATHSLGVYSRA